MAVNFFKNLSNNYLELLNDKEDFNVIIKVGETTNAKTFYAHAAVLKYRSLYFKNKLLDTSRDENNIKTINLGHISAQQFDIIIKYIYGGIVLLENLDASAIFELKLVTSELLLKELSEYLESYLMDTNTHWLRLNFAYVYRQSFHNYVGQELQKWSNNTLAKHPRLVFDSEDFISLEEDALVYLIKCDDLQMDEIKIWNYVIKWGIAQNPDLPSDIKNWSAENFQTLKTTLQNCLPLIRYFQIAGEDIANYVKPYKRLLEKNLWNDVKMRFMNPKHPVSSEILPPRIERFSTVIEESHAAQIASWIDKTSETYSVTDNPYEFKLLFRGSRDGYTVDSFWDSCNKKANIVIVIKVKDTDEILGGYNPISWDKRVDGFKNSNKSFIFSLKNGNIKNSILSKVINPKYAIRCYNISPGFGYGLRMHMSNGNFRQTCACYHDPNFVMYQKPIRSLSTYGKDYYSTFSAEECEIFQIYKKNSFSFFSF